MTERQLRLFEVILVCAIAFGGTVLYSVGIYFGLRPRAPGGGTLRWLNSGLQEIACLALVWYILSRRSVSFKDLGLCWRWKDLGHSLIVWTLGMLAFSIVYGLIYLTGFVSGTGAEANFRVANLLFGARVSSLAIGFQFLNPFFEELIVRAYLMTEVRQLTNNMPAAVLVSTVLQTSYHLYQGAPLAISEGAIFLAFSLCYAKTNRVTPIVLAHLYLDLWPTLRMWFTQG